MFTEYSILFKAEDLSLLPLICMDIIERKVLIQQDISFEVCL